MYADMIERRGAANVTGEVANNDDGIDAVHEMLASGDFKLVSNDGMIALIKA